MITERGHTCCLHLAGLIHMTNTKTEQKILEIEAHLETEKLYLPPFGTFVKKKQMEEYLADLKEELKEDLKELNNIKETREMIILEAQEEADRVRQEVREEIERQDIALQAREIAREIIQKAQEKAETILVEAKGLRNQLIVNSHKYVDTLFDSFEKELMETQEKIGENREQLRASLEKKMELMQENNH